MDSSTKSAFAENHSFETDLRIKEVYLSRMRLFDQNSFSKGPTKDTNFKLTVIIFI